MEAVEADPRALPRILDALDAHARASRHGGGGVDPEEQIDVLLRAAEGRGGEGRGRRRVRRCPTGGTWSTRGGGSAR